MIMFKMNKIRYKKNEDYKMGEGDVNRNQKIYCVFSPYDKKLGIQDAEFIVKIGGESEEDPYYLDIQLDTKFKVNGDINKEKLRNIIVEEKSYEFIFPYIRTRLLELTMYTENQYEYDFIYEELEIKVIEKREGLLERIKRIINLRGD